MRPSFLRHSGVISFRSEKRIYGKLSSRFSKDIMRIYRSLKKDFFAQACSLIVKPLCGWLCHGFCQGNGRDSGPKGAYAHQYLDRRQKTKTLKPKAILSLKSPLTHWRGVRKVSPQARLERSSDSSPSCTMGKMQKKRSQAILERLGGILKFGCRGISNLRIRFHFPTRLTSNLRVKNGYF